MQRVKIDEVKIQWLCINYNNPHRHNLPFCIPKRASNPHLEQLQHALCGQVGFRA